VLRASGFALIGFEKARPSHFVFPAKAVRVIELLDCAEQSDKTYSDRRDDGMDLCVDWMLWALKYRDWLARMVSDPNCIPMIEMRDGEKVLRISSRMPEKLQREWISYL